MNFPPSIRYRLLAMAVLAIPVAASANQTPLVIDKAQSRLEIAVTATIDSFVARLQDFDAAITVDPASGRVGSASFQADFSAVKTGRADRDRDMNAWQETGRGR